MALFLMFFVDEAEKADEGEIQHRGTAEEFEGHPGQKLGAFAIYCEAFLKPTF